MGKADYKKNSQIELLRAVAIIYTLIHHIPMAIGHVPEFTYWLYKYGGYHSGVDLFFVISGFVITRSLCGASAEFKVPKWRLMAAFWLKRVFRLLPLAWLWLLIGALYALVVAYLPGHQEKDFVLAPILAGFLQVANLYNAYCYTPNAIACDVTNVTGHYWSLSLEEQFYLLYPFLFFLVNRKLLVAVLCIAIVIQFFWARPLFSYAWYFRTDALSWGVLLGLLSNTSVYASSARLLWRFRHALVAVMFLLIILLPMITGRVDGFGADSKSYGVATVALVCAAIVLIASYDFRSLGTGAFHKVMLYLGARSYALYVTHFILFRMLGYVGKHLEFGKSTAWGISLIVLSLLLTLAASELSYRFIESRYRPKGRQLARKFVKG